MSTAATATTDTMSTVATTSVVGDDSDFDYSLSSSDDDEYDDEQMETLYRQYDEMLKREAEENPPEIGYCGFPCDGKCATCGGSGGGSGGGFDMSDEV